MCTRTERESYFNIISPLLLRFLLASLFHHSDSSCGRPTQQMIARRTEHSKLVPRCVWRPGQHYVRTVAHSESSSLYCSSLHYSSLHFSVQCCSSPFVPMARSPEAVWAAARRGVNLDGSVWAGPGGLDFPLSAGSCKTKEDSKCRRLSTFSRVKLAHEG